jgi:zinc/manganese transport system permease protein
MTTLLTQLDILLPAFLAGLLVLATHIPLGQEVLKRGIIFLDLAIAQIAALGVVIATSLLHLHDGGFAQTLVAVITAIIGSLALYQLRTVAVNIQEAIIGIIFILAATGILLLLSSDPHGGERLKTILVGQILWLQASDLLPLGIIYSLILMVWIRFKQQIGEWLFYPLFAVAITLSTQTVGVYLVFASLIIPSLTTLHLKTEERHSTRRTLTAFVIGIVGYLFGLIFSALFDFPAGAAIVWCLAIIGFSYFLLSAKIKKSTTERSARFMNNR